MVRSAEPGASAIAVGIAEASASDAGADAPSRDARGGTAKRGEPIAAEAATGS